MPESISTDPHERARRRDRHIAIVSAVVGFFLVAAAALLMFLPSAT